MSQLNIFEAIRSLAGQQASHSELELQLVEAQNALAILFNQPPAKMAINIKQLPDAELPSIAAGIPADVLIRRPDLAR